MDSDRPHHLTLFQPGESTDIDPQTPVSDLKEIPWKPMMVTVEELPTTGSFKKQKLTYKGLGFETSCTKFFDALARRLALYYRLNWIHDGYPTMGDILVAYQQNVWEYHYRYQTEKTQPMGLDVIKVNQRILFFQFLCLTCLTKMSG